MKKIFMLFVFSAFCLSSKAQVDVELRGSVPNLEIWVKPKTFQSGDFINGITFTISWPVACTGVDLSNSPTSHLAALSMSTAPEIGTVTSGSYQYKTYNGAGSAYNYAASNDNFIKIMTVATSGVISCPFSISAAPPAPVMDGNWGVDGIFHGVLAFTPQMTGNITSNLVVLPVELLSFKAEKKGENTYVEWVTVKEKSMQEYAIERSTDGMIFKTVGTEKPKALTPDDKVTYYFNDDKPDLGINYYRLLMRGQNNEVNYSKIVSIDFGFNIKGRAFPNPFTSGLTVDLDIAQNAGTEVEVILFDLAGKQIFSKKITTTGRKLNYNLPTEGLTSGSYLVRIQSGKDTWQQKITKQ